jgi:hypothetical protein
MMAAACGWQYLIRAGLTAVALAIALGAGASAQADPAQDAFDALYGAEYAKVVATPDKKDDLALAAKFLDLARDTKDEPQLMAILCTKAFDLACTESDGFATAVVAMRLLAQKLPAEQPACHQKLMALYQKQYETGKPDVRREAGEALAAELLSESDALAAHDDLPEALKQADKAYAIAAALKSAGLEDVQDRRKTLSARVATIKLLDGLRDKLKSDPKDAATRNALIRACLVELDTPAEAAKYLDASADAALQEGVPLARKAPADLGDDQLLAVAEFYRGLASPAAVSDAGKIVALRRARLYYDALLERHPAADAVRQKAGPALDMTRAQLSKLAGDEAGRPARSAEIQQAIDRGVKYLRSQQRADGVVESKGLSGKSPTLLTAAALLECGISPADERMAKTLDYAAGDTTDTRELTLRCLAFSQAVAKGGPKYRPLLAKDVAQIVASAGKDGAHQWACAGKPAGAGKVLPTAWALAAVSAGADARVTVPAAYWNAALGFLLNCQKPDGSWGDAGDSPAGCTAAALAGIYTCLNNTGKLALVGDLSAVKRGFDWLDKNPPLTTDDAAHDRFDQDYFMQIYDLGLVGILSGRREIGGVDWYRALSGVLIRSQAENGCWTGQLREIPSTGYSLLFLGLGVPINLPGGSSAGTTSTTAPASSPATRP